MRILLKHGANVNRQNADGISALEDAAGKGNYEMVKLLLDKGADINMADLNVRLLTEEGATP